MSYTSASQEHVNPDPDFNDPGEWTISTVSGTAEIADGKLTCTNWKGTVQPNNMPSPDIGDTFYYEIVVDSSDGVGLQAVQYGTNVLWSTLYGAGTFSGTDTVNSDASAINVAIAFTAGSMVISQLTIQKNNWSDIADQASTYSPLSSSSSWSSLTDQASSYTDVQGTLDRLLINRNDLSGILINRTEENVILINGFTPWASA